MQVINTQPELPKLVCTDLTTKCLLVHIYYLFDVSFICLLFYLFISFFIYHFIFIFFIINVLFNNKNLTKHSMEHTNSIRHGRTSYGNLQSFGEPLLSVQIYTIILI